MRTFDTFEQQLIQKLKDLYVRGTLPNMIFLIDDCFQNMGLDFNKPKNIVHILYDSDFYPVNETSSENIITESTKISRVLMKTIFLLEYLESQGYIFMFTEGMQTKKIEQYSKISNEIPPIKQQINDPKICKLILEFYPKSILISQSIVDLVNDNFKSKEEIRHVENLRVANENLEEAKIAVVKAENSVNIASQSLLESKKGVKLSRCSIWVALGIGILSLCISSYSIYQTSKTRTQKVEIDSIQFLKIEKMINTVTDEEKVISKKTDSIVQKKH